MESMILRGINTSGLYTAHPGCYMSIQNIILDMPLSGVLTNATVTVSGAQTGAFTFNDSAILPLNFKPNEDVYVTTANFLSNYGAVINYIQVGEGDNYMTTDRSRTNIFGYATPWRLRSDA